MILTHLVIEGLKYFQVQILLDLLGVEQQRIFGLWVANQSTPSMLTTASLYAIYHWPNFKTFLLCLLILVCDSSMINHINYVKSEAFKEKKSSKVIG